MSTLSLQIVKPVHGTGFPEGTPIPLQGTLTGDPAGLFFTWFSSLNGAATASSPELNTANHAATILNWSAPLPEFGSHVIVLAAADRDGLDLPAVQAVTRSAMAGGLPLPPPPSAGAPAPCPAPCVVHRLVALIRTPAADGQVLSKASATLEFLAPVRWARQDPAPPGNWIADPDYQQVNGIGLGLGLAPVGPPDPAHSATLALDLAALAFFRADDRTWFRWTGALPANLGTGNYRLTLSATGGGAAATAARQVVLTP